MVPGLTIFKKLSLVANFPPCVFFLRWLEKTLLFDGIKRSSCTSANLLLDKNLSVICNYKEKLAMNIDISFTNRNLF